MGSKRFQVLRLDLDSIQIEELEDTIKEVLKQPVPVILDAGALSPRTYEKRKAPTILTPHPGEFSRLTGKSSAMRFKVIGFNWLNILHKSMM